MVTSARDLTHERANAFVMFYSSKSQFREKKIRFLPLRNYRSSGQLDVFVFFFLILRDQEPITPVLRLFIYYFTRFGRFACLGGFVLVISFRCFRF